jgi:hypothetical protein
VAGVSGRSFRCGNADALEREREARRHHYDDGKLSNKRMPRPVHRQTLGKYQRILPRRVEDNKAFLAPAWHNRPVRLVADGGG